MSGKKPIGRHQERRLTAATVRGLKEPGLYGDGQGLYLKVDKSGAKRWVQRLVIQGKRRDLGLGSASLVDLAEAREKALQQRKAAREGDDPVAAKNRSKAIPSFKEAARLVHEHNEGSWKNDKHKSQWLSSLESYAFPFIGSKSVDRVDSADILHVLDPIWLSKAATASRVKQRIGMVLKWSIARGYRADNPADTVQQALARQDKSKVRHMPSLPYREVRSAIQKVTASLASDATKLAFDFLVHTATRSGEVRNAEWNEFDLERHIWTVPASRMKAKKEFRVPLTPRTLAILEAAKSLKHDDSDLVFPNPKGKALSDMTLSKLMKELGIPAVPHGFRSSFRIWASEETNHSHDVVEQALAHAIKNKVEAAYNRTDLLEKRKKLMVDWSAYLEEQKGEKSPA